MIIFILTLLIHSTIYAADFSYLHFLYDQEESSPPNIEQQPSSSDPSDAELESITINHATIRNRLSSEELKTKSTQALRELLKHISKQEMKNQEEWPQHYDNCRCKTCCVATSITLTGLLTGCLHAGPLNPISGCCLGGISSIPCCVGFLYYYIYAHEQKVIKTCQYERDIVDIISERAGYAPATMTE